VTAQDQRFCTALAVYTVSVLACQRPAPRAHEGPDSVITTAATNIDLKLSRSDSSSATIRITTPTLIVAFPRPTAGDSTQDTFEAYNDWSFYADRAATFLKARGVRPMLLVVDTLDIINDGKESIVVVPRAAPLCYLVVPGRPPLQFNGYDSDADIIDAAGRYFWAGKVPRASTDTLTVEKVHADYVITRPTFIGFFSRRALRMRGNPSEWPDSARLVDQVEHLRDSLAQRGIAIDFTFEDAFTVLIRGQVDTVRPVRSGGVVGYYVAHPDDWRQQLWVGPRTTSELVREIDDYVDHFRSKRRDDSAP